MDIPVIWSIALWGNMTSCPEIDCAGTRSKEAMYMYILRLHCMYIYLCFVRLHLIMWPHFPEIIEIFYSVWVRIQVANAVFNESLTNFSWSIEPRWIFIISYWFFFYVIFFFYSMKYICVLIYVLDINFQDKHIY